MTAWLVYEKAAALRNRWYIDMHMKLGALRGIEFSLILCDNGLPEGKPDFAIVRAMRPDITRELEARGVPVFNNSHVSEICNNKARTYEYLHAHGIPVIPWISATQNDSPPPIFSYPAVIKPCCGHGGQNVSSIHNAEEYSAARKAIAPDEYVIQPLANGPKCDTRVYILGNEPVAAVERTAVGDFRSNFSLGGKVKAKELTTEERKLIYNVCKIFDFDYCGIDIMYHEGKPVINEIEDVVGSRMLYATHNIDIVAMYLDYIVNKYPSVY